MTRSLANPTPPALALALLLVACGGGEPPVIEIGAEAPGFELPALDGGTMSSDALGERPAVISFWATWCRPCLKDIPELNALAADGDVAVVAIALDDGGRRAVEPFLAEHELRASILLGNEELFRRWGGFTIPYTLVLDEERVIRAIFRGTITREEVRAVLEG